jgi:hypothetical protein
VEPRPFSACLAAQNLGSYLAKQVSLGCAATPLPQGDRTERLSLEVVGGIGIVHRFGLLTRDAALAADTAPRDPLALTTVDPPSSLTLADLPEGMSDDVVDGAGFQRG